MPATLKFKNYFQFTKKKIKCSMLSIVQEFVITLAGFQSKWLAGGDKFDTEAVKAPEVELMSVHVCSTIGGRQLIYCRMCEVRPVIQFERVEYTS